MQLPLGHEEMSPVQLALEVALHELTCLHRLHVTVVFGNDNSSGTDENLIVGVAKKFVSRTE